MGKQQYEETTVEQKTDIENAGVLWIVATPIGTLEDLSGRAQRILAEVELILAEDTRHSRKLLSHFDIPARGRMRSLHRHNEKQITTRATQILSRGGSVALVSDAGTPVLSDPGHLLVCAARDQGAKVLSVPGPSAFTAALAASPQEPLPATLVGFLPPKAGERSRRLKELAAVPWTLVVLLSPHRLPSELAALAECFGEDRPATLMAELSKAHERVVSGTLGELSVCSEVSNPRGEYVIVVGPAPEMPRAAPTPAEVVVRYSAGVESGLDRRSAIRAVAGHFGVGQREVYSLLLEAEKGT